MTEDPSRETILISRYSSRRLYNTHTSAYVTLDEVAQLISDGYDIQVVDKKTGDDLTRQILLQIITEHEAKGDNVLPLNVLTDIVRSYGDKAQSFIPDFLTESFSAIKQRQAEMLGTLQQQVPRSLDPKQALDRLEEWQDMQAGMLKSMIKPWMPQPSQRDKTGTKAAPDKPADTPPPADDAPPPSRDEELEQMKQQLAQLQEKMKDL